MLKLLREFKAEIMWFLVVAGLSLMMVTEGGAGGDNRDDDLASQCPHDGCECGDSMEAME